MKINRRLKRRLILMEGLLVLGLIAVLSIDRTAFIIRFGLVAADQLILLAWVLLGALFLLLHAGLLISSVRAAKRSAATPRQFTFAPDQTLSPEEMRAELTRFQTLRPQLADLLAQGKHQLENIERKKLKMGELIQRNDVALLGQASAALLDAEQTLCRKLVLVLNRALLCDPEERNARRREAVYQEHERAMQVFLNENEEVLNRCETLLTETVRYVEEKKAGRETMDLQIMTNVIRSLTNDGIRMNP